ncbi:MAG: hypothetical protein MUC36_19110 [Planctomycetes bacterium]|nr:hypothetical protein [Planctomycetota bacterium]
MVRTHVVLRGWWSVLVAMPAMLAAQCDPLPVPTVPFAGGFSFCGSVWDPDGAGPAGPALAIADHDSEPMPGGAIRSVDLATGAWSSLPGEFDVPPFRMVTMPNGDLVVAGRFTTIGGAPIANLARWNGSAWQGMAAGSSNLDPQCLLALPNGDVVVGGSFQSIGGVAAANIARWDGTAWHALGGGVDREPLALLTTSNGDLLVGGWFTTAGGIATGGLARWDGTNWNVVDPNVVGVSALVHDNSGVLHVASQSQVLRINAGITTTVASFAGTVGTIAFDGNGDLLVGGHFQSLFAPQVVLARNLARRSGTSWSAMPGRGPDLISGFVRLPSGQLAVLGFFVDDTGRSNGLLRWDGAAWGVFGRGLDGPVSDILVEANGDAIVGGWFRFAGGVDVGGLARWDGQAFAPLGGGTNGLVAALARALNGDVLVGGSFTAIGGVAANCIARWDGASWTALPGLGASPAAYIESIVVRPNGELVVGGKFTIGSSPASQGVARWNGAAWSPVGNLDLDVRELTSTGNGDLIAMGFSAAAGSQVQRWNGSTWTLLNSSSFNSLNTVLALPNGDLLVGGEFAAFSGVAAQGLARWNGSAWSDGGLPPGSRVTTLSIMPDGGLLAGGWFGSAATSPRLQRWNGSAWSPYGPALQSRVLAMHWQADGSLLLGTVFEGFGPLGGPLLELAPACPATGIAYGAGCVGSGGANVLAIETLPWLGGTFAARSTGLPANGLVLAAYGFQSLQVPLGSLSSLALPGCNGLLLPDWSEVVVPTAGSARSQLAVPTSAALVGGVFFHQHVPLELDPSGNVTAITSSNALRLQIGAL